MSRDAAQMIAAAIVQAARGPSRELKIMVRIAALFAMILCCPSLSASADAPSDNVCIRCHGSLSDRLGAPVELWKQSIHAENGIACNNCHGGDPRDEVNAMDPARGFLGKPKHRDIPAFCGRCHVGVMKDYVSSPHGKAPGKTGPTCVTCHGNHLVKKASLELINEKDCTRCHDFSKPAQIRDAMRETETGIVAVEQRIDGFRRKGIDTDATEKRLFSARNRFHSLFHELDIGRLKRETADINAELSTLNAAVREWDETDRKRKLTGVAAVAAALIAALLLRLYLKTYE